jgi:hypothetical protein
MSQDIRQQLENPAPPALVNAPLRYDALSFSQNNNLLRMFFLKVSNIFNNLLGPAGARYMDRPNGLFFSTTSQTLVATNTAKPIDFEITYLANGVEVNSGTESRMYVSYDGVYNFQFSGQLSSTNSSSKTVYVWIVRNGVDIGYSTHAYSISGSGTSTEISWNFNIDLQAGNWIEFEWAADNTIVTLSEVSPTSPHPGIPSAVCAVSYVAPLPVTLPTPP